LNTLTPALLSQLYSQESNDPFLTLITLNHSSFSAPIRLVNNSVDIISRTNTFTAFPVRITLPADDGETAREVSIEFDNVSRELINEIRQVTDSIDVTLEMVLASIPDEVQIELAELKIYSISYNKTTINAKLAFDTFLNIEMDAEKYTPTNFPGLF
jgi:hypothetical protein